LALKVEDRAIYFTCPMNTQAELTHALRVIERMENREVWFTSRISQLEEHSRKLMDHARFIMATLEQTQAKLAALTPQPQSQPVPQGPPPPLNLFRGNRSLPDHERQAKNFHASLLKEEGLVEGMTPIVPLLPIPTHSLKKSVSWSGEMEPESLTPRVCAETLVKSGSP
jgi:hypothetical protein